MYTVNNIILNNIFKIILNDIILTNFVGYD